MTNVYVLYGLGTGCHREWLQLMKNLGTNADLVHINEILCGEKEIRRTDLCIGPGGFVYKDDFGAGRAYATKLETSTVPVDGKQVPFMELFKQFIDQGGIFWGQCNFFQIMSQLGAVPGWDGDYTAPKFSLVTNPGIERYHVTYALHRVNSNNPSPAFRGIDTIVLPCRHGEGHVTFRGEYGQISEEAAEANRKRMRAENNILLQYADRETGQPTMKFDDNPNGSVDAIGGVTDPTGRVIVHMGHVETIVNFEQEPDWYIRADQLRRRGQPVPGRGQGMAVVENVLAACRG